ncbi:gamma-glutamylcyclotransferase family protein [Mariniblastus fucicola]|uniref:Gamma-glutamylcyclotransferase family protein n=1 Tax=Mariniblastus fucicola TaxID=980251 RepID=A0A5B9PIW2_9BACT|nr:gamma-glutamylcyclotransferase family protein [Mariniblastus fucicola]QEG22691.1 Gamma-glutamylcyclotransferase family protein YtfP [Mariniblastus fucicola]
MYRVFVYGTLKRGFCRHSALESQKFLGEAATEPGYMLYDPGDYPGMVRCEQGRAIEGELFEVDHACLLNLDLIEGVDEGYYSREPVRLMPPWRDESAMTYLYQKPIDGFSAIRGWHSR